MARFEGDPLDWRRMEWREFLASFKWRQGEHLITVGETGSGKTTLLSKIVPMRTYVVVFVTKTKDSSFDKSKWPGFTVMREWNRNRAAQLERVLLWPSAGKTIPQTIDNQRRVFETALNEIFRDGGWCVVVDELQWMVDQLRFDLHMRTYQHQARSSGITVVTGFQRPSHVPVITYGSASHAFVSRQSEDQDVKRLAALGGVDAEKLRAALPLLPRHEWLYLGRAATTGPVLTKMDLTKG
jgi:ABC-type dipeptide/oligopeptide/nickel transport system ATPase component